MSPPRPHNMVKFGPLAYLLASLRRPRKFQRVLHLGSVIYCTALE